jgi:hypothetical protein
LHCPDIIITELPLGCMSQEISTVIWNRLAYVSKLLFVKSVSVDVRDSLSETHYQRLTVRDSLSETQCQRPNVRDSMSKSDLLTWLRIFATPRTSVSNFILVYERIVLLSYLGFHAWTPARPSVNADRVLTASMSWIVCFSTEV